MLKHAVRMVLVGVMVAAPLAAAAQDADYVVTASRWGAAQAAAVEAAGGTVLFGHDGAGVAVVRSAAADFVERLRASSAIQQVERDQVVAWQMPSGNVDAQSVNPNNDPFFPIQWAPRAIDAPAAWAAGCTGQGVRVAILDGGIYAAHVDLAANIDVAASRSFVPGFAFNQDTGTFWHGTHVAGIVAAADNNLGVVGIAPQATIIGVKVLHAGSGSFAGVINGILYAATPLAEGGGGADIINMSLGATFSKQGGAGVLIGALAKAVNYADRHGVLVVSAAGNNRLDLDHSGPVTTLPAQSGSGIAVAATGPIGVGLGATNFANPASYTNYGNSLVNVAAPGGDFQLPGTAPCTYGGITTQCWVFDMVLSTARGTGINGGYSWAAGTSMAAPAASAVAAMIKQRHPGISLGALKTRLAQSAQDLGKKGNDPFYGKGWVNALAACQQ
jgi:lantibiotic leader peptide-processing serine protease